MIKLAILLSLLAAVLVGSVAAVKALHRDLPMVECVGIVRKTITDIVKAFVSEPKVRHSFEMSLSDGLKQIAEAYVNKAFEITTVASFNSGTPFVGIHFVSKAKPTIDMLNDVSSLMLLKFRHYIMARNLNIQSFVAYSSSGNEVNIYIYYAEFPEDWDNLLYRYKLTIAEQSDLDYGFLEDDELNKELERISKQC